MLYICEVTEIICSLDIVKLKKCFFFYDILDSDPDDPSNKLPTNALELRNRIQNGPFQPILKVYPRIKQSGRYRCFQSNWFKNYPWLEYSEVLDRCFCFLYRVFSGNQLNAGQIDKTFSKTGFTNWYKGIESFRKHQLSKCHVNSVNSMKNYLNEAVLPIDQLLDETRKVIFTKKETERIENRKLMERIIDIIICLAKCGKSFRGHNESLKSNQRGLFFRNYPASFQIRYNIKKSF